MDFINKYRTVIAKIVVSPVIYALNDLLIH